MVRWCADAVAQLPCRSCLIDGAVACHGIPDFKLLIRNRLYATAQLYAFDILEFDGEDLRGQPIETRKAALERLLGKDRAPGSLMNLAASPRVDGSHVGSSYRQRTCALRSSMQIHAWWAATQKVAYRCRNRGIVLAWQVDYSNRMAWRKFRARPGLIFSE